MMRKSNERTDNRDFEIWHLHRVVEVKKRGPNRFEHLCYWAIWEMDGTDDGKWVADVRTSHEDAIKMAEALGDIIGDDHEAAH